MQNPHVRTHTHARLFVNPVAFSGKKRKIKYKLKRAFLCDYVVNRLWTKKVWTWWKRLEVLWCFVWLLGLERLGLSTIWKSIYNRVPKSCAKHVLEMTNQGEFTYYNKSHSWLAERSEQSF